MEKIIANLILIVTLIGIILYSFNQYNILSSPKTLNIDHNRSISNIDSNIYSNTTLILNTKSIVYSDTVLNNFLIARYKLQQIKYNNCKDDNTNLLNYISKLNKDNKMLYKRYNSALLIIKILSLILIICSIKLYCNKTKTPIIKIDFK